MSRTAAPLDSEAPSSLGRFFGAMAAMLELRSSPSLVEEQLGPSPSGTHRLGFYEVLARRSRFIALRQLCPATRHAAIAHAPNLWSELVTRYSIEHPPRHADPNRFAAGLSDFLAALRERDPSLPAYLEELIDFEFHEWEVGVAMRAPTYDDPGLGHTLHVRHYDFDVPGYVEAFRLGRAPHAPEAEARAVIIYRDVHSERARWFYPTPLGLAALGRRLGRSLHLPSDMADALDGAEKQLERDGILLPRP